MTIHVPVFRAGLFHTLWAEAELTVRLVADNAIAAFLPGLLCTATACVHNGLGATAMAGRLAEALALFFLYLYVFASNQAGRRKCIGDNFALTETTIILSAVAAAWQLRPTPYHRARPRPPLSMTPARPHLTAEPRLRQPARAIEESHASE